MKGRPSVGSQLFQHTIVATGEVRDADGNLIDTVRTETVKQVTEDEMREIIAAQELEEQ